MLHRGADEHPERETVLSRQELPFNAAVWYRLLEKHSSAARFLATHFTLHNRSVWKMIASLNSLFGDL